MTLRAVKGGRPERGKGVRSGTRHGDAGVKRNLGSRFRATRHRVQVRAAESGKSGRLYRWTGDLRPETKGGNRVYKKKCSSVSGWHIQEFIRKWRVMGKDTYYSWQRWGGVS